MALRGKKPETIQKRFKALFYGDAGVGKTFAAIQFPRPYLIDTERGAENDQYVEMLSRQHGLIYQTYDFDDLITEVKALLTTKHEYKTLIIDPLTTIYSDLVDRSANILKDKSKEKDATGEEFGRHYAEANKKMKRLFNLLYHLDMNVVITAHEKNESAGGMNVFRKTFDCYSKAKYIFDLALHVQKRANERIASIEKTRIEGFKEGDLMPFSYEEISNRYGKDKLEKDAVPIELASKEDVHELMRLIKLLNISSETVDKWLTKSQSSTLDEMRKDAIIKCIDHLKSKINITEEAA